MSYNIHPYQRAHEAKTDYAVFSDPSNPYNYKNLGNMFQPYQRQQNLYYNTRQLNPISLVKLGPQWMNPNNYPSDNRPPIYQGTNLNNLEKTNQYQIPQTNPNILRDFLPAKQGYYSLHDPQYPRQISNIQAGQSSSFVPFHGMQLY
jgi:hypothetical protein